TRASPLGCRWSPYHDSAQPGFQFQADRLEILLAHPWTVADAEAARGEIARVGYALWRHDAGQIGIVGQRMDEQTADAEPALPELLQRAVAAGLIGQQQQQERPSALCAGGIVEYLDPFDLPEP